MTLGMAIERASQRATRVPERGTCPTNPVRLSVYLIEGHIHSN